MLAGTRRWMVGGALWLAASCAHAPEAAAPGEEQSAEADEEESRERGLTRTGPARASGTHRPGDGERPSMGPSRVYTRDELDSTGETDLDEALRRLGHHPR